MLYNFVDISTLKKQKVINKKQIKKSAENILANKLCRCIKKNDDYPKNESKAIGEEIIKRLIEIGLESKPCHQDL